MKEKKNSKRKEREQSLFQLYNKIGSPKVGNKEAVTAMESTKI